MGSWMLKLQPTEATIPYQGFPDSYLAELVEYCSL